LSSNDQPAWRAPRSANASDPFEMLGVEDRKAAFTVAMERGIIPAPSRR
jgi:hypothetical protein